MHNIVCRLQVIAAIDPDFPRCTAFKEEILGHRAALLQNHAKMVCVRCGTLDVEPFSQIRITRFVACADIYTGATLRRDFEVKSADDTAEFRRKVQARYLIIESNEN